MQDNPPIRYRGMLVSTAMDEWEKMGLKPGHGDDRFDGIKAWSDGSNQAYTGYQRANIVGRLEPGKYADLATLEGDPTTVSPTDIAKIKVSETWLAGERRYGA